jgi:hypothetical protein
MVRIFLLSLFILGINVINAQPQTFKKDLVKNFNVNPATTLMIDNYNGNVDFELWTKNEIEVNVSFEVTTSKIEKAQTYLQALSASVKTDTNYIGFITLINKEFLDKTFNRGKSTYKINYHVKIPVYLNLTVKNYYGDIHLTESSGFLYVTLNYGTFTATNLTSDESKSIPKIDVNYGECIINKCNFLNVDANYSVVKVSHAESITGKTSYSEIYTDDVLSMVLKSRYDKIQIGKISKINVDMAYSKLKISNVLYDIQCVAKYTPVDINNLSESFTNAWFDLTYSDANINVSKQACFNLNAKAKYGKIHIPKRANVNNYISPIDMKTVGTIGCISGANSQMTIDSNFGDINITDN